MENLFAHNGLHVLVDGQYGSTGKGLFASWLARQALSSSTRFSGVISSAGPNSGHTFYHNEQKVVLKQLPSFAVYMYLSGFHIPVFLSAGAIIDPDILRKEAETYPGIPIFIHPNAAVITEQDRHSEADPAGSIAAVAGTRSGTGMALARKVMRDPTAVAGDYFFRNAAPTNVHVAWPHIDWRMCRYFVEVSQGYSLGINQQFYPKCTSRECTVSQALADAGMPPKAAARTYMTMRTFPIRVGNVDGHSSGDWYPDQREITWEELGVEPELTTVTQRVRRIATFSMEQARDAMAANDPNLTLINFLNYLRGDDITEFVPYLQRVFPNRSFIGGYGPKVEDIVWL